MICRLTLLSLLLTCSLFLFFFNDTATTEIYTLSLHDALPIYSTSCSPTAREFPAPRLSNETPTPTSTSTCSPATRSSIFMASTSPGWRSYSRSTRSEEHTSELQSRSDLVCRLLLEKKKKTTHTCRHQNPRSFSSYISQAAQCKRRNSARMFSSLTKVTYHNTHTSYGIPLYTLVTS